MPSTFDIIGDIHGQTEKLENVLTKLGYTENADGYSHSEGRKALFLGDFIDPKPNETKVGDTRKVLQLVKSMCDAGNAKAIMGNHEFNALLYHTRDAAGAYLRPHTENNLKQHQGTLDDFPDYEEESSEWRQMWMPWFIQLPFYIDLEDVRVVHASWHPESVRAVGDRLPEGWPNVENPLCDTLYNATENLLKGLEIGLPDGLSFPDKIGQQRSNIRTRWWMEIQPNTTYRDLVFPDNAKVPEKEVTGSPSMATYCTSEKPIFIGHYYKPKDSSRNPEAPNLYCLDFQAAGDGPVAAYRFNGEQVLSEENLVFSC